jgi:hypothetical protein
LLCESLLFKHRIFLVCLSVLKFVFRCADATIQEQTNKISSHLLCNRTASSACLSSIDGLHVCSTSCGHSRREVLSHPTDRRRVLPPHPHPSSRSFSSRSFSYVYEARNTSEEKRARDEVANYQRFSDPNLGLSVEDD